MKWYLMEKTKKEPMLKQPKLGSHTEKVRTRAKPPITATIEQSLKQLQFSIEITAPRENVWVTLWEDKTFRDWANIIDEGTYMVGEIKEGNEVQFISSASGYGVTSLVEKLTPNEHVSFRQISDTKDSGRREREKEWAGGRESYTLTEEGGITTLTVELDVPPGQTEAFKVRFPKALQRVKALAEG